MGRLLIKFHLNARDNLLHNFCTLLIRSTSIRVPVDAKNRHLRILSKAQELLIEISLADNMRAALDSQSISIFDNSLMLSQYLGGHSEPRSTHDDSREGSVNKLSSSLLKTSADVIPDCLRSCASVVFSW
jgi:hypothetical protein